MKGASACVESVFSGVKRLLGDFAATMSPELLELYVFMHYNWAYEFMRSTVDEIVVKVYISVYGPEQREEDMDSSDGEDEGAEDEGAEDEAMTALEPELLKLRFLDLLECAYCTGVRIEWSVCP